MQSFFTDLYKSVTDTSSYSRLSHKSLKLSLSYFLFWLAIASLITTTNLIFTYLSPLRESLALLSHSLSQEPLRSYTLTIQGNTAQVSPPQELTLPNSQPNALFTTPNLISLTPYASTSGALSAIHIGPDAVTVRVAPLGTPLQVPWNAVTTSNTTITPNAILENINVLSRYLTQSLPTVIVAVFISLWLNFTLTNLLLIGVYLLLYLAINTLVPSSIKPKNLLILSLHTSTITQLLTVILTIIYTNLPDGFMSWTFIIITAIALYSTHKHPSGPSHSKDLNA